ncbi:MAG: septal ring lytic transglycosylase RlpA family protein [Bacteroidales bacterium]|nr:septal ring lytic transglycosylase RlpA family protein [Bacteroidales bacterium]
MVRRILLTALMCVMVAVCAEAQNYSVNDTTTEYPNKGTFYHDRFEGRKTASGEVFDQNKFTAAHWRIKLGTMILVTNRNSGKQVIVKVNDRCPKHGVIDLSHRAAVSIGIKGCQPVTVRILPSGYEERWMAQDTVFDSVSSRLVKLASPQSAARKESKTEKLTEKDKSEEKVDLEKDSIVSKLEPSVNCRIVLCTVASHSEAFDKVQSLPELYRQRVIVEPIDSSEQLDLILPLTLPLSRARELAKALSHTFGQCKLEVND